MKRRINEWISVSSSLGIYTQKLCRETRTSIYRQLDTDANKTRGSVICIAIFPPAKFRRDSRIYEAMTQDLGWQISIGVI